MNYYNEIDPRAAEWLRQLIWVGAIADGEVDTRSIEDVTPNDLRGFTQCHFFAGIGGWSLALRLAGWPDTQPVWTGSCPCQPFSQAGKGGGLSDERHLWPAFEWLIRQCRPASIFGEQVASPDGLAWLDVVSADLEGQGYAAWATDLCAAGIGAPHIRQRLYWVAHAGRVGQQQHTKRDSRPTQPEQQAPQRDDADGRSHTGGLGDAGLPAGSRQRPHGGEVVSDPEAEGARIPSGADSGLGDSYRAGSQGWGLRRHGTDQYTTWAASLVDCRDGKRRPIEPGSFPLAHGVPGRVGLLRGYGNAIVPQVAAEFIGAYLDTIR